MPADLWANPWKPSVVCSVRRDPRGWRPSAIGPSAADAQETRGTYADRLELGNDRIALIHLAPVVLGEDFLGTVSILRDITHEVEVDRLKSEFVATISHELRTPITSVKGYVEMLLMGAAGTINENQSHFLDVIKRNIDRLNTLVDGLLEISRIEAGKVSLALEELDLTPVARDVIGEMERTSAEEKKPMSFSLQVEENLPRIRGDAAKSPANRACHVVQRLSLHACGRVGACRAAFPGRRAAGAVGYCRQRCWHPRVRSSTDI